MHPTILDLFESEFLSSSGPWGKLILDEVLVCPQCGKGTDGGEYTNFVLCGHFCSIYVPASCCEKVHAMTGVEAAHMLVSWKYVSPLPVLHINDRYRSVISDVDVASERKLRVTVAPVVTLTHIMPQDKLDDICEGLGVDDLDRDWLEFENVPLNELESFKLPQPTQVLPDDMKESNILGFAGVCSKCGKPCQGEMSEF